MCQFTSLLIEHFDLLSIPIMESCIDHFLNFTREMPYFVNPIYIIVLSYRQLHLLKKRVKSLQVVFVGFP